MPDVKYRSWGMKPCIFLNGALRGASSSERSRERISVKPFGLEQEHSLQFNLLPPGSAQVPHAIKVGLQRKNHLAFDSSSQDTSVPGMVQSYRYVKHLCSVMVNLSANWLYRLSV